MRVQLSAIVAVTITSALGLGSAWGQSQQPSTPATQTTQKKPDWKDRAEYDLVQSALSEKDPQKKLDLLDQWKTKYPETDFKEMRLEAYIEAYKDLQQPAKMLATAKDLMDLNPKNLKALYWLSVLSINPNQTTPDALDLAQKAATQLLAAEKPAGITDDQWAQTQGQMAVVAHHTLAWVYTQRKDYPNTEKEVTAELKANPRDSEAVYWMAGALRAQAEADKKPELIPQALFYYARAAAYDGPGSFDATRRKTLEGWLQKAYTDYHGEDADGFQALLAQAKTSVFPPDGFTILTAEEVKAAKLKSLQASDPALAMWVRIKEGLTGPDGDTYFNNGVKDAIVPPDKDPAFHAKVISMEPARAPKTVKVSIEDGKTVDAILVFETPLARPAEPGTSITFHGTVTSFTKQPFMVTFEVEKKNLTGWPAPPKPVVHHKKPE